MHEKRTDDYWGKSRTCARGSPGIYPRDFASVSSAKSNNLLAPKPFTAYIMSCLYT